MLSIHVSPDFRLSQCETYRRYAIKERKLTWRIYVYIVYIGGIIRECGVCDRQVRLVSLFLIATLLSFLLGPRQTLFLYSAFFLLFLILCPSINAFTSSKILHFRNPDRSTY
jgi:hypothetical protein